MTSKIEKDYRIVKNTKILGDNSKVETYKLQELVPRKFLWFNLKDKWRDIKLPCIGDFKTDGYGTLSYILPEFNTVIRANQTLGEYKNRFIFYNNFNILRVYRSNAFHINHSYREEDFRYYILETYSKQYSGYYISCSSYHSTLLSVNSIIESKKDNELQKKKSIILETKQEIL